MKRILYPFILILVVHLDLLSQTDSLGLVREGEQVFVMHKTLAKQTLYSLSIRYMTSIEAIEETNPDLANGLKLGQTLKIPYGGEVADLPTEQIMTLAITKHEVSAGETLFSISQQYEVSVADLKNWNKLETNDLALGQELRIEKMVPSLKFLVQLMEL